MKGQVFSYVWRFENGGKIRDEEAKKHPETRTPHRTFLMGLVGRSVTGDYPVVALVRRLGLGETGVDLLEQTGGELVTLDARTVLTRVAEGDAVVLQPLRERLARLAEHHLHDIGGNGIRTRHGG